MAIHRFVGRVVARGTDTGLASMRVEVHDLARRVQGQIAAALTDAEGDFELTFSDQELARRFGGVAPTFFFQVQDLNRMILVSTEKTLTWRAKDSASGAIEVVSGRRLGMVLNELPYAVFGRVADLHEGSLTGLTVRVYQRELGSGVVTETIRDTSSLPASGRFRLNYVPSGVASPDIIVRVESGATELAKATICRAKPVEHVDLLLNGAVNQRYPGKTRYRTLKEKTDAQRGALGLSSLTAAQIDFIACQARLPSVEVDELVKAAQLDASYPVSLDTYFALIHRGLGSTADELFRAGLPSLIETLKAASEEREISPGLVTATTLPTLTDTLRAEARNALRATGGAKTRLGQTVDLMVAGAAQNTFLDHAHKRTDLSAAFWAEVDSDATFTSQDKARLRFVAEATSISGSFLPLTSTLIGRVTGGSLAADAAALAAYSQSDWETAIGTAVPAGTPGTGLAEQRANYAKALLRSTELRFRSARIRHQVAQDRPTTDPLRKVLEANTGYAFEHKRVGRFLAEGPSWAGLSAPEQEQAKAELYAIERLVPISERYDEIKRLRDLGLDSSHAVHLRDRAAFIAAAIATLPTSPAMTAERAEAIHDEACWRTGASFALRTKHAPQLASLGNITAGVSGGALPVLPDMTTPVASLPAKIADWSTLFGTPSTCACRHCRSVLGPAAYLVDLLELLDRVPRTPSGTAKELLFERRPDLAHLALSCENGLTPLPLVDVINEVMEVRLASASWPDWPATPRPTQTEPEADELAAQPALLFEAEHLAAATALSTSVYPLSSPFHLFQEEARIYLDALGVPRAELLTELTAEGASPDASHLALERLRIASEQYSVLANPSNPADHLYWGLPASGYPASLGLAKTFLQKAEISYDELRELVTSGVAAGFAFTSSTCDLDVLALDGLGTANTRNLLHRVLRLRLALGWSISDTARLLTAFGTFDATLVQNAAAALEVARRLGAKPAEVLAFYADMDRNGAWEPSLFERVFLDKRVLAPADQALSDVLATGSSTLTFGAAAAGLIAALGIDDRALRTLIDPATSERDLGLPALCTSGDTLDIGRLSRLYRAVVFARHAKLEISELLTVAALSGIDPVVLSTPVAPESTLQFLKRLPRVRGTGLTVTEIHYVLRHVAPEASGLDPSDAELETLDSEVLGEIARIAEEVFGTTDPSGAHTQALAALLVPLEVANILALAEDTLPDGTATTLINGPLAPFVGDTADAIAKLVTPATELTDTAGRYAYLAARLARYATCARAVVGWVARTFEIDPATADHFLGSGLLRWPQASPTAILVRAFIPASTWNAPAADAAERKRAYRRLAKVARVVRALGFTPAEWVQLTPNGGAPVGLPFLDFQALPLDPPTSFTVSAADRDRFSALLRLGDVRTLAARYPAGREALFATFAAAATSTLGDLVTQVARDAQLTEADVSALATQTGVASTAAFRGERALVRILDGAALLQRAGVSAATLVGWLDVGAAIPASYGAAGPHAISIAREIKRAARAKAGERWAEDARRLRDPLRERQRRALVGALLVKTGLGDARALSDELLLDVETSPCALTSRLVAAHGSLQSFVNRILLQLEEKAPATTALGEAWSWMRQYRLWEANRKVFLWPENWIEPELRGDKSELFEQLESNLLQGAITEERALSAYRSYLEGLVDLANLEIVAIHTEERSSEGLLPFGGKVVHAFGRTRKPHRYYHRTLTAEGWSDWRKMDVDVQGEHLVPVSVGGRLYVFWMTLEERSRIEPPPALEPPAAFPLDSDEIDGLPDQVQSLLEGTKASYEAQAAAQQAELASHTPPKLTLIARLSVAERREGGWSSTTLQSDEVDLGLSLLQAPLWLRATVDGGRVLLGLSWSNRQVARFVYEVGAPYFRGQLHSELEPLGGHYASGVHPDLGPVGPNVVIPLTRPAFSSIFFQDFALLTTTPKLRLYLDTAAGPEPAALVLSSPPKGARLVVSRGAEPAKERPYLVLRDDTRSFFGEVLERPLAQGISVLPALIGDESYQGSAEAPAHDKKLRFSLFYHPFAQDFARTLALGGLDGLLKPAPGATEPQQLSAPLSYGPSSLVESFPKAEVELAHGSAYGVYNWELFFHAPLLIATRLSQEGRYREAQDWFHTIFDPTRGDPSSSVSRYWRFRPFAENASLADIQAELAGSAATAYGEEMLAWADGEPISPASESLSRQIATWRRDPFDPHAIARLRTVAYQKAVVLKYLDNLIAWGDQLFSQDSIESINEATQLYLLASRILGTRPVTIEAPTEPALESYSDLEETLDAFSNAVVASEVIAPKRPRHGFFCVPGRPMPTTLVSPYFCVPPNERLLHAWDTVADRLFKIRHCQNLEGVVRALPLYQPPIDPALLVRATAAGVDLSTVLDDLAVGPAPYRYAVLAARAAEAANAVVSLGSALLSALEKKDAEELAQLRATHEVATFETTREIRRAAVEEARESLAASRRALAAAEERFRYYDSRELVSAGESLAMTLSEVGAGLSIAAQALQTSSSQTSLGPDIITGVAGIFSTPFLTTKYGAENFANSLTGAANALEVASRAVQVQATSAATMASYQRRMDDWRHQAKIARLEVAQLERQVAAGEIRLAMSEHELRLVQQQLAQSRDVERHLRTKFTSKQLYGWMVGQLSAVYHQTYRVAFDLARRAEKAFQYERATDQTFVKLDAWDGLKCGLVAGERLAQDLRRMDAAYHTQNKREHELTKTLSLAQIAPEQLIALRTGAEATFSFKESLFDDDFPTHTLRRLKSVSVTLHSTPGPYQAVAGQLTLLASQTRQGTSLVARPGVVSSIATSTALGDAGVFNLDFRDERYLPFEGAGAHWDDSGEQWRFELTGGNELPFDSISDLVLTVRYTAREGRIGTPSFTSPRQALVWVPGAFADGWQAYREASLPAIDLALDTAHLPKGRTRVYSQITAVKAYARWTGTAGSLQLTAPGGSAQSPSGSSTLGDYTTYTWSPAHSLATLPQTWKLTPSSTDLSDLWVAFTYTLTL
ncbi:MAG: hypothetical protein IPG04_24980 [Polyangiaceae bacterium]|nr:hypothetical protein [Polyangiaceae bacterium]